MRTAPRIKGVNAELSHFDEQPQKEHSTFQIITDFDKKQYVVCSNPGGRKCPPRL
jgi:hypothetical protein